MLTHGPMLIAQAQDAVLAGRIETIMWAQVTMAVVMVFCALGLLAGCLAVWLHARKALRELEAARSSIDERVQRFGVVMDVVQEQAQEILLDLAAAASGMRAAARALREEVGGTAHPRERDATGSKPKERDSR